MAASQAGAKIFRTNVYAIGSVLKSWRNLRCEKAGDSFSYVGFVGSMNTRIRAAILGASPLVKNCTIHDGFGVPSSSLSRMVR